MAKSMHLTKKNVVPNDPTSKLKYYSIDTKQEEIYFFLFEVSDLGSV